MCSYIVEKTALIGSAKGRKGWMRIDAANVYFDHPYHSTLDHVLAIICAIAAVIYITAQAGSLPTFMPGYAAGSARIHSTHALAAAIAAVVLFIMGWAVGRSRG